jgi:hypothetical protein
MSFNEYNFPNVERHVYDVDAFEILDRLREKYLGQGCFVNEEMLSIEEQNLLDLLEEEGYNPKDHLNYRNFILPSNYNLYNNFLAYKLLTIDLYKIEPFLSYQSVLFLGNYYAVKDNFIGLLEFLVYDFVQKRVLPTEQVRLEKIVNWLERNRVFLLSKAYNDLNTVVEAEEPIDEKILNETLPLPSRKIKMNPEFANILCEKLNCFFEGQEQALYNLIIKNELTRPLVFDGQANQLAELFKRLRYNAQITVSTNKLLAEWLVESFCTKDDNGNSTPFVFSSVEGVLKNSDREPPKTKRILIELAQYIQPDKRKNDKN